MKKLLRLYGKFNNWLASLITKIVGSMSCAYIFAILALCSFPEALKGGVATLIAWIAQTFLQLVLLSVIMVGQDVQSRKANRRAEQDHKTLMDQFKEMKKMHRDLHRLIEHYGIELTEDL